MATTCSVISTMRRRSRAAIVAIGFVLINFAIDFLYNVLDPRIRERAA